MKRSIFIASFFVICIVPLAKVEGWVWPPEKSFTLAELSAVSGVNVKIEAVSTDVYAELPQANFSTTRPNKKITILIFPNSTLFSPSFFKDYGPYIDPEHHSVFTSNLQAHLVVVGADTAVLSATPISFHGAVSNGEAAEMHIEMKFWVAADLMANSYLMLHEEFRARGGQLIPVFLGARPDGWR